MPLRPADTVTERIELTTPGDWVEVKTVLSRSDRLRAFELSRYRDSIDGELSGEVDLEKASFGLLEVGVVAWSFDEPVRGDTLRRLADEDFDIIRARVDELWGKARTDDERKN